MNEEIQRLIAEQDAIMREAVMQGDLLKAQDAVKTMDRLKAQGNTSPRVDVEQRLVESMTSGVLVTLRQVTDAANAEEGSFVLGTGAVHACLERMIEKGSVMVQRGDTTRSTLFLFVCYPDCVERAQCPDAGKFGHSGCGTCKTHNRPIHHCGVDCFNTPNNLKEV